MRIAIISTPRSGNTWLRSLLSGLYEAEQIAVHSPDDIDWNNLPTDHFILQLHWHRTSQLRHLLALNNFKIVVLHRHPFDVLISILQFAHQEPQTAQWLNGDGGDEKIIHGETPSSEAFLEYAVSNRASQLFSISEAWSNDPEAMIVKYEYLVNDTERTLDELVYSLGLPCANLSEVVACNSIEMLRETSKNGHFWQGRPGLWKELIPSARVEKIAQRHKKVFLNLGYDFTLCNTGLTADESDKTWRLLCQLKDGA